MGDVGGHLIQPPFQDLLIRYIVVVRPPIVPTLHVGEDGSTTAVVEANRAVCPLIEGGQSLFLSPGVVGDARWPVRRSRPFHGPVRIGRRVTSGVRRGRIKDDIRCRDAMADLADVKVLRQATAGLGRAIRTPIIARASCLYQLRLEADRSQGEAGGTGSGEL